MREYKLGFTTSYERHDEPRKWLKPARVIVTSVTTHHAVENGRRLCVDPTFWSLLSTGAEILARPFERRLVTCKACQDTLEANRITDLEAEVEKLREQSKSHQREITDMSDVLNDLHDRTRDRVCDLDRRLRQLEKPAVINVHNMDLGHGPIIDALSRSVFRKALKKRGRRA